MPATQPAGRRHGPSRTPSQSLSRPSQVSGVGVPALTEQVVVAPTPQTMVPVFAQVPTPTVQGLPVGRHVPPQLDWPVGHTHRNPEHAPLTGGEHAVPAARGRSAGHAVVPPAHSSGASHTDIDGRHGVDAGAKASDGHTGPAPSQVSARSQSPAATRHGVPAAESESTWQIVMLPEQAW